MLQYIGTSDEGNPIWVDDTRPDFTQPQTSSLTGADSSRIQPVDPRTGETIITRFIRTNEIQFVGTSLCPDKLPIFWFDSTNVNAFCQKGNRVELYPSYDASIFAEGEGIVNAKTNAYAQVIATSNNIVYLNQNFVTLSIVPFAANTLSSSDYSKDDIIYQTTTATEFGNVTFQGRVMYYDSLNGILAISPETGTLNASFVGSTTAELKSSVIIKANGTNLANAVSVANGNIFPANSIIRSVTNPSSVGNIYSYSHSSGAFWHHASTTQRLLLQANAADSVGNTVYITTGSGIGEARTITALGSSDNEVVLNAAINLLSSNSKYTFGTHVVDEYGKVAGIFNIPEGSNFNFQVGSRVFTITDNQVASANSNDYLMRATAIYEVSGKPSDIVKTPVVIPPPVIIPPPVPPTPSRRRDPLAQTFFTPEVNTITNGVAKSNYGIYVSSIDLFFSEKPVLADLQMPITVEIVEVQNGIPTNSIIASSTVECKNVKVSTIPDATNPNTITNFRFADPVYLKASTEYAIVVKSDSPDYNVFICELGGYILGSTPPRRVSQQPYLGSFYKSQNASTWTPIQNQDLMFRINKCVFTEGTGTVLFKPKNQQADINIDSMLIHTVELNHKPTFTKYKFRSTNVNDAQDADFAYAPTNQLYAFGADLVTSTKSSARRRVIPSGNSASMSVGVELNSSDFDVSPLVNIERLSMIALENYINDASISNTDISITTGGIHANAANITVTISAPDLADGVQANAYVASLTTTNVASIIVDEPGSGYITTPTITFSEPKLYDNTGGVDATGAIAGETSSIGGNCKTRYVTKQITLDLDSGDLRVYVDANRPAGTNIHVYYKAMSASDPQNFSDKKWQLMNKVSDIFSKDQKEVIELEYRPNLLKNVLSYTENGTVYPLGGKFKYFAIKIVLTAGDPTVYPTVYNFRTIATPAG